MSLSATAISKPWPRIGDGTLAVLAALAFVLHSSLAAILMCVALVATGALPVLAGAALTLGANLGGALIPVRLGRGLPV